MNITLDQLHQSLSGLLPQGWAWPRDPKSVLMAVMRAKACELLEHTQTVDAMVRQWQPAYTVARLAEWEALCGLPDACLGANQTRAQRRAALLEKLRGPQFPFEDSSACAPAVIEEACAQAGYEVEVVYNTPLRVGRARVGDRLGALDGRLYVLWPAGSALPQSGLQCVLERVVPARYSINIILV